MGGGSGCLAGQSPGDEGGEEDRSKFHERAFLEEELDHERCRPASISNGVIEVLIEWNLDVGLEEHRRAPVDLDTWREPDERSIVRLSVVADLAREAI